MEESAVKKSDRVDSPTLSTSKNDSLDDFKSPKIEPVVPVISKVKILNERRPKKTNSRGKTSSSSRKKDTMTSGRQTNNGKMVAQPSIESSFFKAANSANRGGHTCPLCMKYFSDVSAGTSHSKNCATKNNVSTTKLLAAVALQERQADERLAIGLPPGPFVQPREKAPRRNRDRTPKADPDLQLALALSKSLSENELAQEFEEALLLAAEHRGGETIIDMTESQRRKTLKNFGFITNKPAAVEVSEGPTRSRRRKHLGPTILQTRTKEARDRLLTEKIAEILMGNESITQVCPQSNSHEPKFVDKYDKHKCVLRSRLLNEIHQTTKRIWDSAQLSSAITNFYVEELGSVVLPNDDHRQEKSANHVESLKDSKNIEGDEKKESSESNEIRSETEERVSAEKSDSSSNLIQENKIPEISIESKSIYITDRQYRNALPNDWSNTLNVSSMSDVIVLVKNNHIWAHKLVFHVRCSDILLDCEPNNDTKYDHVKEKICWLDIDYLTALAFLEFVYSGLIVKNCHIFEDNRLIACVRRLARKYRLKSLFDYLRKSKAEIDIRREIESRREGLGSPIVIEVNKVQGEKENLHENLMQEDRIERNFTIIAESKDDHSSRSSLGQEIVSISAKSVSPKKNVNNESEIDTIDVESTLNNYRASTSPDLFDESIQESDAVKENRKSTETWSEEISQAQTQDNSNLKVLAQLIADDETSSEESSQRSSAIKDDKVPEKLSPDKTIHNHTTLAEGRVETPKSRGVVNETSKINERSRSQRLPEKQKSNLSLFIEKVQRINAKGALDSYTEEESLGGPVDRRRFRNPFNINNVSNQSIPECGQEEKSESPEYDEEVLSVNDEDSQSKSEKENCDNSLVDEVVEVNEISRMRPKKPEESCLMDETINTDDKDISMYSRYKKTHEHDNSISNYRNVLKKLNQATPESTKNDQVTDDSLINDNAIDLTQESDTDVDMPESSESSLRPPNVRKSINRILDTDSNDSVATMINSQEKLATVDNNNDSNVAKGPKSRNSQSSITSSPVIETTVGQAKGKQICSSIEDLDKDLEELANNSRKSLEFPDLDIFEVDEEIFAEKPSNISLVEKLSCPSVSGKSGSSQSKGKSDGRMKENSSIDELTNNADGKSSDVSSQGTKSPRNSLEYPDSDVFVVNEDIFTQSLKNRHQSSRRTLTPSPRPDSPSKFKSSRHKRSSKATSLEDLTQNEENGNKCTDEFSNSTKSPRNSSEYPDSDFSDLNEEIFTQSLKNPDQLSHRTLTPSPRPDSRSKLKSSRRKRSSKVMDFEDLTQHEENGNKLTDNISERTKNSMNSPEYPHFDFSYQNEESFTQSLKNPQQPSRRTLTPSPRPDSPNKLKSSRRKQSSKSTRIEDLTHDEETNQKYTDEFSKRTQSPMNSSEFPSFDCFKLNHEIFTQSLQNDSPRRSLTSSSSPDADFSRKSSSFRRKKRSNEGRTRHLNLIDNPTDESSRGAKSPRTSPEYPDLRFSDQNDEIFTQSLKNPDYSSRRSLTPVTSRKTLQLPSPIVISSSPELDSDFERRFASIERNANKQNTLLSDRNVSPLNSRQSISEALGRLSPLNFEASPEPDTSRREFSSRRDSSNSVKKLLSRSYSMPVSSSNSEINRKRTKSPKKSSRLAASQELTPPTNYNAMDTPELKRELDKYGIKPQNRKRARQLLNHIYSELHPALPLTSSKKNSKNNLVETSDDEEPPVKKIGKINDGASNDSESDRENSSSQESVASQTSMIAEEMDFSDGDTAVNKIADSTTVKEAFNALVKADKTLHNKLLIYEPLPLEPLHATLKAQGFKCKLNDLMDFLDEECITFQVLAQLNQKRTRKGGSKTTKQIEKSKSTEKLSST